MTITIDYETDLKLELPVEEIIHNVIEESIDYVECPYDFEVNVLLTDNEGIHQINLDMRDVDRPTDVLSFPEFEFVPGEPPTEEDEDCFDIATGLLPLGDMVISVERVKEQAKEYGHSTKRELSYLVVHSVLHLLGYDHLDEGPQKAQMREREDAIMEELGILR